MNGGILTGKQIQREVERGRINIDPFDTARLNPNSYDLSWSDELMGYEMTGGADLDMKRREPTWCCWMPRSGFVMVPGVLYLATTVEAAGSDHFVPSIETRSSVGRLGIEIHRAGWGDLGFGSASYPATWTLEVSVIHPVKVYPFVRVCQIVFTTPCQDDDLGDLPLYRGKYVGQRGPQPSRIYRDFEKEDGK